MQSKITNIIVGIGYQLKLLCYQSGCAKTIIGAGSQVLINTIH